MAYSLRGSEWRMTWPEISLRDLLISHQILLDEVAKDNVSPSAKASDPFRRQSRHQTELPRSQIRRANDQDVTYPSRGKVSAYSIATFLAIYAEDIRMKWVKTSWHEVAVWVISESVEHSRLTKGRLGFENMEREDEDEDD